MSDVLAKICDTKRVHVKACKRTHPLAQVEIAAKNASPARGFGAALASKDAAGRFPVITEIKKASPSAGVIRADFDPAQLASAYETAGAACLSVLTETPNFQGADEHVRMARNAGALPALRKDFMIDPYQVVEARALGADCILIILAAVDDALAKELEDTAYAHGMDVLIETHNGEEFDRALKLRSPLIGINNRNLKTLNVDLETTVSLAPQAPADRRIISESGIGSNDDLKRLWDAGARGFLVGERLMRQANVTQAAKELIGEGR
ncbi:MAG: indole-3-glycerol phosphate synthase TrpC [Alphaproteobacteria bacterium]